MTVAELITELQKLDPSLPVLVKRSEGSYLGHHFEFIAALVAVELHPQTANDGQTEV